ncbi:MAG: Efflux pump rane transporter BepE [Planctomycetota bacterium]|jgi:multidrug efflux pump
MSLARTFTHRPISATVLSLLILIGGLITLPFLPVSEYPEVVPPSIVVNASYPGAAPETVADTVAGPLEQQFTGIPGLLFQSSTSTADGQMALSLTFRLGTDMQAALVEVQNRIARAQARLPEDVRRLGVSSERRATDLTMVVHLVSTDGRVDPLTLANYATLAVKDELNALPGVGQVRVFGAGDYAMRIWLDPDALAARSLTPADVVLALREQNAQIAGGAVGAQPNAAPFQLTVQVKGRLADRDEFAAIAVRSLPDGRVIRLGEVARIELGAGTYAIRSLLSLKDGEGRDPIEAATATAIPIFQAPGSNALAVADAVRARMAELAPQFPPGVEYRIVYDPTRFIQESIDAVVHTLIEAVALVVVVVIVFLQTWRAAVIPLLAVPVSIVGTFAVMYGLGYSINNLSLFGLVLAIGIVVDDAIVVVENVERNIALGLDPRRATVRAMSEVTGPIVATAAVLCAVFIPAALVPGLTGRFYQQFAVTIAISTVISAINSLTLSPALAAVLLRGHHGRKDPLQRLIDAALGWFFRPFNALFAWSGRTYQGVIARLLRLTVVALLLYGGLVALTAGGFADTPRGFIPPQDKGYVIAVINLPDGAGLDRTEAAMRDFSRVAMTQPEVQGLVMFPGMSFGFTANSSRGIAFVRMRPHADRRGPGQDADAVAMRLSMLARGAVPTASIFCLNPPPVIGLGSAGGFKGFVQDRGGHGLAALKQTVDAVIADARASGKLSPFKTFDSYPGGNPVVQLAIDRAKAQSLGVQVGEIATTLAGYLGSAYANDLNLLGRTWQVMVQADDRFRADPDAIGRLLVRDRTGALVPLSAFATVTETVGPSLVMRYNGYPAIDINTEAAPGLTNTQGQEVLTGILQKHLKPGMTWELTDVALQEKIAGNAAAWLFPLCVLLVFLVLAALYESWLLPLVVILIVPMCLLFSLAGLKLWGMDLNIMVQIGFLVLVGLACKNAILIVEFARDAELRGQPYLRAALEACRLRLRPILMTSIAFIMGVVPLVIATGAGAELRKAMGVAVFSGMIGVTIVGLLLTPVFYAVARRLTGRRPLAAPHLESEEDRP